MQYWSIYRTPLSMISIRFLTAWLALLAALPSQAESISGRIVSIIDGNTLLLVDAMNTQHPIGLAGADSPERGQDFGPQARSKLAAMAFNRQASADCQRRDHNQRQICLVRVAGMDVGLEQVRAGLAWWDRQYAGQQTSQERASYEQAEFDAKTHRRGLWNSKNPVAPWEWRKGMGLVE